MSAHLPRHRATGSGVQVVSPQPGSKGTAGSLSGLKAARDCCNLRTPCVFTVWELPESNDVMESHQVKGAAARREWSHREQA